MIFKKDDLEIDVSKVMWDGSTVSIDLTKGAQGQSISCGKEPHSDFKEALDKLRNTFLFHMELDGIGLGYRVTITGVEERETKNGSTGYRIHAVLACPGISQRCRISTSTLTIPAEGFFEWEDEDGFQKNDPEEYLYLLQDHEIEAIEAVFTEGFEYAINGKLMRQPDLLDTLEDAVDALVDEVHKTGGTIEIGTPDDDEIPPSMAFPDPDDDMSPTWTGMKDF